MFSSNADPLEEGQTYDKFALFAHFEHEGGFKTAAKDLAGQGYGPQEQTTDNGEDDTPLPGLHAGRRSEGNVFEGSFDYYRVIEKEDDFETVKISLSGLL